MKEHLLHGCQQGCSLIVGGCILLPRSSTHTIHVNRAMC